jgi:hypothetical protein
MWVALNWAKPFLFFKYAKSGAWTVRLFCVPRIPARQIASLITYTAARSAFVSKIPRLLSRSVRSDFRNGFSLHPSSSNFDTFNQTWFLAAFRNMKAGNFGWHHLLTKSLRAKVVRIKATRSDNELVAICRLRSSKSVAFCRSKLSLLVACAA